ncbi:MAG TPA: SRPBCC family protein [Ramlibacter sp.]|jgi:carbon monoxide dehydrogenase subunit G|uniref:SRPBCC family protein n=1 Tax=Ramlibacter sp. TaxID=1917967 RepID=UPI002D47CF55|nr:SRPBCC family protein [Ramlibacter sp.]HZY17744.1 SRPBCC family protein [Ramlibacter sp.]
MATIRKTFDTGLPAARAWDAVRDFGALHTRLVPGFVTACTLEEDGAVRLLTFANGLQVRERRVTCDDAARRLVYTAQGGRATHYNAAVEVADAAGGCRVTWTVDLLPDALAGAIDGMMDAGVRAMQAALR